MEVTGKTRKPSPWSYCDLQDNWAKLSNPGVDTDGHVRWIHAFVLFSFLSNVLVTVF